MRKGRAGAAMLVGASIAYQQIGQRVDRRRYPPPGRLTLVGGRRLHWVDHGGAGTPIMIQTGAGSLALGWDGIVSDMAARGHVYSYDRAGLGWSSVGPLWPSTRAEADDLAAVMADTGESGPWILVGHSLGGIYARTFLRHHPDRVGGLVLVDPSHEQMVERIRAEAGPAAVIAQAAAGLGMVAAPRSLMRLAVDSGLANSRLHGVVGGSTPGEQRRRAALYLTSAFRLASLAELTAIPRLLRELRDGPRQLGSLPLAVVTSAEPLPGSRVLTARFRKSWMGLQEDLASLSSCSTHITARTGGHFVHADDPKAVLAGLDWVLEHGADNRAGATP